MEKPDDSAREKIITPPGKKGKGVPQGSGEGAPFPIERPLKYFFPDKEAEGMSKKKHVENINAAMKNLGTYKPEFDTVISVYADLLDLYDKNMAVYRKSKFQATINTENGGQKTNPVIKTLETIRKDIAAYSDRLGINPKALETMRPDQKGPPPKKSALADILKMHG